MYKWQMQEVNIRSHIHPYHLAQHSMILLRCYLLSIHNAPLRFVLNIGIWPNYWDHPPKEIFSICVTKIQNFLNKKKKKKNFKQKKKKKKKKKKKNKINSAAKDGIPLLLLLSFSGGS
jgi:hypothetical protein